MREKKLSPNQKKIVDMKRILVENGWIEDRFGHMTKTEENRKYRYKFQATSVRKEEQPFKAKDGAKWTFGWILRWSAYYKDVTITEENKFKIPGRTTKSVKKEVGLETS